MPLTRQMKLALYFCLAIAVLPLIQLIPLPPWLWTALPNRQPSAETFAILGQAVPWMPISVSPQATWLSALSLVPPLAIFLSTILLAYRERRLLSLIIIAVGIVSVFIGLIQVAQGEQSPLRFFAITNPTEAVGFFANRNHFASFLYCLIVFTIAWTVGRTTVLTKSGEFDIASIIMSIAAFTVLVILLAGEMMARSRTGLALTMVALFASIALSFSLRRAGSRATLNKKVLLGALAVAVIFSLQFAVYRVLERASDLTQDDRPIFARTTIEAAIANMPIGSGMGTFVPVYAMFEKPQDASPAYVNHAHNDILEVPLETGVLGLLLMGLFAAWFVPRSIEIWRSASPARANDVDWSLARAATIVVGLIIIHCLFDYPLRTGAMMAVMAFACALLIEPPIGSAEGREKHAVIREKIQYLDTRRPEPVTASPLLAPTALEATRPVDVLSLSADRRWGANVEWPEEWSKSAKPSLSSGKNKPPSSSQN